MSGGKETQYATYSFIIIMFVFGLPLWWKTTEVYRKPLPYSSIDALSEALIIDQNVRVVLKAQDIGFGNTLAKFLMKECSVPGFLSLKVNPVGYTVEDTTLVDIALDLSDLDSSFPLAEGAHLQLLEVETTETPVVLGRRNNLFFTKETPPRILAAALRSILMERGPTGVVTQTSVGRDLKSDISKLRRFAPKSTLNILFTLSNPDPDSFDLKWRIKEGVKDFLDPVVTKLEKVLKLKIASQHIYFTPLGVTPKRSATEKGYYISEDLSLMINPLESRLGAQVVPGPTLHFVVLVPPEDFQPLHIPGTTSDSFIVHRWGGVMFYNVPESSSTPHFVDMKRVMRIFVEQFRLLLGIDIKFPEGVSQLPLDKSAVADWEVDFLLRMKTVENLLYSIKALKSLAKLLETITNIVISDEVADNVTSALHCIERSGRLYKNGSLEDAFTESLKATEQADAAFFDPSMLALLYFPSDQKYAIYVPLFLPVGIPVLISAWSLLKIYFTKFAKKDESLTGPSPSIPEGLDSKIKQD